MIANTVELCRVFSNSLRFSLLELMSKEGEIAVNGLSERFDLSQPTISIALNELLRLGLISRRKEKRTVYYSLIHKEVYVELRQNLSKYKDLINLTLDASTRGGI